MKHFAKKAKAVILKHGGQPDEGSYEWVLDTKYGPLHLSVDDDTVFTRFDFPKVAHPETDCNPFSGKWNFHYIQGWTVEQAVADLDDKLARVKPTTLEQFTEATGLLPEVIASTVIEERDVNLTDPTYVPVDSFLDHDAAVQWFVNHVAWRTVFLYDNNDRLRKLFKTDQGRDGLYAFTEHWLDAYIHNPPDFRKKRPLL